MLQLLNVRTELLIVFDKVWSSVSSPQSSIFSWSLDPLIKCLLKFLTNLGFLFPAWFMTAISPMEQTSNVQSHKIICFVHLSCLVGAANEKLMLLIHFNINSSSHNGHDEGVPPPLIGCIVMFSLCLFVPKLTNSSLMCLDIKLYLFFVLYDVG